MKRLSVLLILSIIAGVLGGCGFAIVEGEPVRAWGFSAMAEGDSLFQVDNPDISYLDEEPLDLTPPPAKGEETTEEEPPFEEPEGTEPIVYATPGPTKMPRVKVTPEPTPEPTVKVDIGLHSQDTEGDDRVRRLQLRLAELGYLDMEADGVFGSRTLKALKRFQEDQGLEQTGIVDGVTDRALYPVPEVTTAPEDVKYGAGASGDDIRRIQSRLREYGFLTHLVNGEYDEETYDAVRRFQQYAVENYGTEFDEPEANADLSETVEAEPSQAPASDVFGSMPVLAPEATFRPDHPLDGLTSEKLFDYLDKGTFNVYRAMVQTGDTSPEVERVQRRLITLEYFYNEPTGVFDELTAIAVKAFQKRNDLQQTGIADEETQRHLFSEAAVFAEVADDPFYIKVSIHDQRVYVYRWMDGGYNQLIKSMICSTGYGTTTPTGVFVSTGHRDARWHYFVEFNCWAQYAFVIKGPILFHSVIYSRQSEDSLRVSSLENLGHKASHGCVRLMVADAKWIYDHCGEGQVIEIY